MIPEGFRLSSSSSGVWCQSYSAASAPTAPRRPHLVGEWGGTCLPRPSAPPIKEPAALSMTWPHHRPAKTPLCSGWSGWRTKTWRRRGPSPPLPGYSEWNASTRNWTTGAAGAGGEPPWPTTLSYWSIRLWSTWGSRWGQGVMEEEEEKEEEEGEEEVWPVCQDFNSVFFLFSLLLVKTYPISCLSLQSYETMEEWRKISSETKMPFSSNLSLSQTSSRCINKTLKKKHNKQIF